MPVSSTGSSEAITPSKSPEIRCGSLLFVSTNERTKPAQKNEAIISPVETANFFFNTNDADSVVIPAPIATSRIKLGACCAKKWAVSMPRQSATARTIKGLCEKRACGSWAMLFESTTEMNYRFHVMCLWEHIKCRERVKSVSGRN